MMRSGAIKWLGVIALVVGLAAGTTTSNAVRLLDLSDVSLSTPLVQGEAWDYATRTWGNPWDMDQASDVYLYATSCPSSDDAGFANVSASGGIWHGETNITGAYMWLLNPGFPSSLDIGEDGQISGRAIDADTYDWITFRMYAEADDFAVFYWTKTDLSSVPYDSGIFRTHAGWNIYAVQMMSSNWSGSVTGLRLNPSVTSGRTVEIDWVRVSAEQTGNTVSWSGSGMSGDVAIAFDSDDGRGYVPLRVIDGTTERTITTGASSGSFVVPASLASGTYRAQVTIGGVPGQSPGEWEVKAAPIAQIVSPSYTSGEDWVTSTSGNPWDMEGTDDVDAGESKTVNYSVSSGVLDITNVADGRGACDVQWPHRALALNLHDKNIDTSKYRYFTFRYKVDNAPDQGAGGVSRVRWLKTGAWAAGRTDDMSLYNGDWNVYKLDLSTVTLEAETAGWTSFSYDVFQIMANESHLAWTSHLDWARLTADNTAHTSASYTVGWNILQGDVLTTTIYWDADRNPGGLIGGTVVSAQPAVAPPGPLFVYVPLVERGYAAGTSELTADHTYVVSTTGLSSGSDYYAVLQLEDGVNTVHWYSELPVKMNP
jgi:hypothetical protein